MNHYHEWLESNPPEAAGDTFGAACRRAICFAMPPMDDMVEIQQPPALMRLPYDVCWFEGRGMISLQERRQGTVGFLLMNGFGASENAGFTAFIFTRVHVPGRGWCWFKFVRIQWSNHNSRFEAVDEIPEDLATGMLSEHIDWLGAFLAVLNCVNISRVEHQPSESLQKARARRGKVPLYSYWTLKLEPDMRRDRTESGGTHSPPRLHLRRGHMRQHHPGRWCWVNPHAVGNKKLGIVHKDYAVQLTG